MGRMRSATMRHAICTVSGHAICTVSGLSDPRHFDHILPFLCPEDIPHCIDLSADDICKMHEEDGDKIQRMPLRKSTRFRVTASGEPVLVTPDSGASDADSGEKSGELDAGEPDAAEQDKESPSTAQHKVLLGPKDYRRLKWQGLAFQHRASISETTTASTRSRTS
jgi:hypothetical protein